MYVPRTTFTIWTDAGNAVGDHPVMLADEDGVILFTGPKFADAMQALADHLTASGWRIGDGEYLRLDMKWLPAARHRPTRGADAVPGLERPDKANAGPHGPENAT